MLVLCLAGWSGTGKTTLLTAMLPRLIAQGLTVSTVKHTHHRVDLDQPGKDSYRHRAAGAHEVLLASAARWALLHEIDGPEPSLADLLGRLAPVDLVLVEGFKASPFPKLEVHRPSLGQPPIWPGRPDIVAVASDELLPECDRPVLPLADVAQVVAWVTHFLLDVGVAQPAA
jgi:molybdopterin-guanine dinucleotide biosynthesis adapter protein